MSAGTQDTLAISPAASEAENGSQGTIFLFISLYSLLLAFFIVLYTTAEISQHKADAAKASVSDSFRGDPATRQTEKFDDSAPLGATTNLRDYYAETRKLAKELLEIEDAAIIEEGDTLILKLPVNLLFTPGSPTVDDRKLFLHKMADSLTTGPAGMQIDVEFRLPKHLDADSLDTLVLQRAGAFARLMVEMGIPEDTIYTGIAEGDKEMLEITFSPRDQADTRLEF